MRGVAGMVTHSCDMAHVCYVCWFAAILAVLACVVGDAFEQHASRAAAEQHCLSAGGSPLCHSPAPGGGRARRVPCVEVL